MLKEQQIAEQSSEKTKNVPLTVDKRKLAFFEVTWQWGFWYVEVLLFGGFDIVAIVSGVSPNNTWW